MKKFMQDFKEFVLLGNVMNLAVGIIIGAGFSAIVTSLTDNLLSPIIGLFARSNLDALKINAFGITLRYGAFMTSVINFVIMAFVVFLLVRAMTKLFAKKNKEAEPAPDRLCPYCKSVLHLEATRCPACTSQL
ncbi:MAG: large conductance mechanosensitive channel protein MscL [Syntrophobacterales bacterium]|nr:large conductance mechanosensitive channel protein MscL [Syntrophobacterales bacterium]